MNDLFYIWSFEHDAWWAAGENGYVDDHRVAGKFPFNRALEICKSANLDFYRGYADQPNECMIPVVEKDNE